MYGGRYSETALLVNDSEGSHLRRIEDVARSLLYGILLQPFFKARSPMSPLGKKIFDSSTKKCDSSDGGSNRGRNDVAEVGQRRPVAEIVDRHLSTVTIRTRTQEANSEQLGKGTERPAFAKSEIFKNLNLTYHCKGKKKEKASENKRRPCENVHRDREYM